MIRGDSHTHAGAHVDDVSIEHHRHLQRFQHGVGDAVSLVDSAERQQHRELVAAHASDGIAFQSDDRLQAGRGLAEQQVPDGVPQRVVDVFEMVEVHQEDRNRRAGRRCRGERFVEAIRVQRAVGKARERVAVREVHDVRLTRCDAILHSSKRGGQLAKLVAASRRGRGRVVARGDPPRNLREVAHRPRDVLRDKHAEDDRDDDREQRDQRELPLQSPKWLERERHRLLQHGDHGFVGARRQAQHPRDRGVAIDGVALRVGLGKAVLCHIVHESRAGRRCERARLQAPAVVALPAQEGDLQSRQVEQVPRQRIIDREADRHPCDRQWGEHRDDDKLIELIVDKHHRRSLLSILRLSDQLGKRKRLSNGDMERIADDPLIEIDRHHHRGVDALAVIDQHAFDGLPVSGRDDLPECVVRGHQPRPLNDALRVLLEQAIEYARSGNEIVADRLACGRHADGVDEIEPADLNDDHQQQKQREDARLQAAKRNDRKRVGVHVAYVLSCTVSEVSQAPSSVPCGKA